MYWQDTRNINGFCRNGDLSKFDDPRHNTHVSFSSSSCLNIKFDWIDRSLNISRWMIKYLHLCCWKFDIQHDKRKKLFFSHIYLLNVNLMSAIQHKLLLYVLVTHMEVCASIGKIEEKKNDINMRAEKKNYNNNRIQ